MLCNKRECILTIRYTFEAQVSTYQTLSQYIYQTYSIYIHKTRIQNVNKNIADDNSFVLVNDHWENDMNENKIK